MAYVINHLDDGVFVGSAMGLAFFTNHDCAGQEKACAFPTREIAQEFIRKVFREELNANFLSEKFEVVDIGTDRDYATADDLARAGLVDAAKALMTERLNNFEPGFTM